MIVALVHHLLTTVSLRLNKLAERRTMNERPVASPRAARLRDLEDDAPEGLRDAIGKPLRATASNGAAILAWRRAALAIDDYRRQFGWSSDDDALGPRPENLPAGRAHDRADRAASQVRKERVRARRGGGKLQRSGRCRMRVCGGAWLRAGTAPAAVLAPARADR